MPYIEYLQATPQKDTLQKYPQVAAWWKRVSERPSWGRATGRG
jgi:glutathione S-transferase